ncbi:hypothetical protein [Leptospira noguchii]|uniref:hypothetical protein n=1 Tax=Leptospira noguchii TaxID=28182 RepID=UPI0003284D4B|nr:hypothetical protein [Leptospira noguchii]EMS84094.1 hypothetical protein LEP1GSC073_2732 [Leptospira noguchii str. Cascata]
MKIDYVKDHWVQPMPITKPNASDSYNRSKAPKTSRRKSIPEKLGGDEPSLHEITEMIGILERENSQR